MVLDLATPRQEKDEKQPLEHTDPPDVATVEEKTQETEVSAEESPENQQLKETAE